MLCLFGILSPLFTIKVLSSETSKGIIDILEDFRFQREFENCFFFAPSEEAHPVQVAFGKIGLTTWAGSALTRIAIVDQL